MIQWLKRLFDSIRGRSPEFEAPDDFLEIARSTMYHVKAKVGAIVRLRGKELDGYLVVVEGKTVIGGIPAWYDGRWNAFVGGTCQQLRSGRVVITIAHAPGNRLRIHGPTLDHEFGHGWLFGIRIYGHDPRFDAMFDGWASTRALTGVTTGEGWHYTPVPESIDLIDAEGMHVHIDLVSPPQMAGTEPGGEMEHPTV